MPCAGPGTPGGTGPAWVPFASGRDPADPVDNAIAAAQEAVFPAHGLAVTRRPPLRPLTATSAR